jgi:CDP-paratose 2-epimerase
MQTVIITGSAGLIGSESVRHFCKQGFNVIGIDNNMRRYFFGEDGSTQWVLEHELSTYHNFRNYAFDIRDKDAVFRLFQTYNSDVKLVIHTAAQPSHDWAAKEPFTDFTINANGTLNLLEATRQFSPDAVFIFTSTNKVYGDTPNSLPLIELETRWEVEATHPFYHGIDETMSIDHSKHSLFGASKVAADILVQEYGRYFGMKTVSFRGGCLTGPAHSGAELHGFLAYLMKCAVTGREYRVFGYKGKQVRDNIHSQDLVKAFDCFYRNPRCGEVYNIGGSRYSHCSLLEAVAMCEQITGNKVNINYVTENRNGDHIWYVSNISKFKNHYPEWSLTHNVKDILVEIFEHNQVRWKQEAARFMRTDFV